MNQNQTTIITNAANIKYDADTFIAFNDAVRMHSTEVIAKAKGILFKVNLSHKHKLFEEYLSAIEEQERQASNCNCCKSFLRMYGGLVVVNPETGVTKSVLWDETIVPEKYVNSVKAMRVIVEKSLIREVFYKKSSKMSTLGIYRKGGFEHFSVLTTGIQESKLETISEAQASLTSPEKYKVLKQHLALFTMENLNQANVLFEHDGRLKNETQASANISWFTEFKDRLDDSPLSFKAKDNLIWYAIATESEGRIKFGNTAVGTFVSNLQKLEPVSDVIAKYKAMTAPDKYMRATVAPTVSNIAQAEKIISDLGLESALDRRFMRFSEIPSFIWKPSIKEVNETKEKTGVFAHLNTKDSVEKSKNKLPVINGGTMTLDRFMEEVLPKAVKIHMNFNKNSFYNFGTFLTATDPLSKPLFKWDTDVVRNQTSMYVYTHGSLPASWSLVDINNDGVLSREVIAISHGNEDFMKESKSKACAFIIDGARETKKSGLGLFAHNLRAELYPIRFTIEEFSKNGVLKDFDEGFGAIITSDAVCGLGYRLVVTTDNALVEYFIDRTR